MQNFLLEKHSKFFLETLILVHYFKFALFEILLVLPFVKKFFTFYNLLDSQKIAPTNPCFKSNMIIQCLINIFYQYYFLMKRINRKTQGNNLYRYSVKIKATSLGVF